MLLHRLQGLLRGGRSRQTHHQLGLTAGFREALTHVKFECLQFHVYELSFGHFCHGCWSLGELLLGHDEECLNVLTIQLDLILEFGHHTLD